MQLWEQVWVATVALPPVLVTVEADSASDEASQGGDCTEELESRLQVHVQGRGLVAPRAVGYVDDTQVLAPGAAALQWTTPTTEAWLTLTAQDVRVDKSCSSSQGERGGHNRYCRAAFPYQWRNVSANWGRIWPWEAIAAQA